MGQRRFRVRLSGVRVDRRPSRGAGTGKTETRLVARARARVCVCKCVCVGRDGQDGDDQGPGQGPQPPVRGQYSSIVTNYHPRRLPLVAHLIRQSAVAQSHRCCQRVETRPVTNRAGESSAPRVAATASRGPGPAPASHRGRPTAVAVRRGAAQVFNCGDNLDYKFMGILTPPDPVFSQALPQSPPPFPAGTLPPRAAHWGCGRSGALQALRHSRIFPAAVPVRLVCKV